MRFKLNPAKTRVCSSCGHKQGESKGDTCEACKSPMKAAGEA
jgi:hypothetical protein